MKKKIKWVFLSGFVIAGVIAAAAMPQAVERNLPEVEITSPQLHSHVETVKGRGIIRGSAEAGFFLTAAVREGDINSVSVRQPAKLYGPAIGDGEHSAVVRGIADTAEQREVAGVTETVVDVVLELVNPNGLIRSGYTAEAVIAVNEPREMLLVPYEAINQDERGEYVLVLIGNTAVRRDIVTGMELREGAEILAGVREADRLILKPENYSENMLVKEYISQ
jgi:hypothetical protein